MSDEPFGGYMFTTAVDPATGRTVWVPDTSRPYFTPATDADRAAAAAAANAPAGKDSRASKFGQWYVSRRTDELVGDAPGWFILTDAQQRAWFGELVEDTPASCAQAFEGVARWIKGAFPGCRIGPSPALTALQLIEHTLPWGKGRSEPYRYPTLGDGLRRLLAATSTQHRMEMFSRKGQKMRRYVSYDARVAFGGYLRHLPIVPEEGVRHDDRNVFEPFRPGKYRVEVTVPAPWDRIGLAPRRSADGFSWEWPATPGESWECWLDECELRLVQREGWRFAVRERILFAPSSTPGSDPLREYAERLTGEIERIETGIKSGIFPSSTAVKAYRAALRALIIQPVGAWHAGSGTTTRHVASLDELSDDDALADIVRDEAGWNVSNTVQLTAFRSRWWRPEWSTAVYARERVQATQRALQIPREKLIAIRGDAVHMRDFDPGWEDTGKVGGYRRQHDHEYWNPERVPLTGAELVALGREVK